MRLLEQAAAQGVEGTLIVGPLLSTTCKCYLARWDGRELVVRQLTEMQQQDWSIDPKGLLKQLEQPTWPGIEIPTEYLVSLTVDHVNLDSGYDGATPLSGTCIVEFEGAAFHVISRCALRIAYFHPNLPRQVTAMWYADQNISTTRADLHFQFSPLFSPNNPQSFRGALVIYLQLFTADNWKERSGCRRISNVADHVIVVK